MMTWNTRFLKTALVYNVAVLLLFWAVYTLVDFGAHYESGAPVTPAGKAYHAVMTHITGGSNDIVPKTDVARVLQASHAAMAWMQIMFVFVS